MGRAGRLLWLLLLLGCSSGADSDDRCQSRLRSLEEHLAEVARWTEPAGAPPDVSLVRAPGGRPLSSAMPLLVVSVDEVRYAERGVGGLAEIERTSETLVRDLRAAGESEQTIALWAEPDVPVDGLVSLLRHAPTTTSFAILVRGEASAESTSPTALLGDPVERRAQLDEAWEHATEGCPAASSHLPLPASLVAGGLPLGPLSTDRLMTALRSCECAELRLDAIEDVASSAISPPEGGVGRLAPALHFGPAIGAGDEVSMTAGATVADLVSELPSGSAAAVWVRSD